MPATAPMVTAEAAESFIKSLLFIIISPFKCRRLICAEQSRPKLYSKRPAAWPNGHFDSIVPLESVQSVSQIRWIVNRFHRF